MAEKVVKNMFLFADLLKNLSNFPFFRNFLHKARTSFENEISFNMEALEALRETASDELVPSLQFVQKSVLQYFV